MAEVSLYEETAQKRGRGDLAVSVYRCSGWMLGKVYCKCKGIKTEGRRKLPRLGFDFFFDFCSTR